MITKMIATSVLFTVIAVGSAMASTLGPTDATTAVRIFGGPPGAVDGLGAQGVGQLSAGIFGGVEARGIYEFDISGTAATEATLNFTNTGLQGVLPGCSVGCPTLPTPASVNVYGYSGDGTASASDFSPSMATLLGTIFLTGPNPILSLDITSFIALLSSDYAGIVLDATGNGLAFLTASITLTNTPLPSTLPLLSFVLGLGGLFHWWRQRRPASADGLSMI